MTHSPSSAREDLGYHQRSRTYTAPSSKSGNGAPRVRPVPRIDPDLLNYPKENDFTRWLAKQKGTQ